MTHRSQELRHNLAEGVEEARELARRRGAELTGWSRRLALGNRFGHRVKKDVFVSILDAVEDRLCHLACVIPLYRVGIWANA